MSRSALLLGLLLLAPLAAADHVFSHRFVVEGRLIGGNGLPVPGVAVEVSAVGERLAEPCAGSRQRGVTDEWGDDWLCYHKHELEEGAWVTVQAGNASQLLPMDRDLRRMVVYLRDADATGVEPEGWNATYHLDGRLWDRGRTRLDGVNVTGITLAREPVSFTTVNATRAEGDATKGSTFDLATDAFGTTPPSCASSPASAWRTRASSWRPTASARSGPSTSCTAGARSTSGSPSSCRRPSCPPGSSAPPASVPLLVGVGLALWGAVALQRRRAR